ncbi:MAG: tetratricopeptide repeat protein [Nanoarchaeota archaeon]|nr:tetratricopeptide repeat protein [Nanoarchaeota archaeon]
MSLQSLSAEELFEKGREFEAQEKYPEAIRYFIEAQKKNPNLPLVYTALGNAYVKSKDPARGIKAYKKSIEIMDDKHAHHNLGILYFHLKMYGKAAHYLGEAEKKGFEVGEVYYYLAKSLFFEKEFDKASRVLAKGHKKTGEKKLLELQETLQKKRAELSKNFPGIAAIRKKIEKQPDNIRNYNMLVAHYLKINDMEMVEKTLKDAVEKNPSNLIAYTNLGAFYFEKMKFKEASELLENAIKVKPDEISNVNISLYINLAESYLKMDQKKNAVKVLEKALAIKPPKSEIIQKMLDGIKKDIKQ